MLVSANAEIWGVDEGLTSVMKAAVSTQHVLGVNVLSSYSLYNALQKAKSGTAKESTWHFKENAQRSAIWTSHFRCIKAYLDEVVVPSAWLKQVSLGSALDPTPLIPPLLANPSIHDDMIYEIALDVMGNYYCEELEPPGPPPSSSVVGPNAPPPPPFGPPPTKTYGKYPIGSDDAMCADVSSGGSAIAADESMPGIETTMDADWLKLNQSTDGSSQTVLGCPLSMG